MSVVRTILQAAGVPLSLRQYWRLTLIFWSSFALISYAQGTLYSLITGRKMLYMETVHWLIHWGLWILLTPVILYAAYRFPVLTTSTFRTWIRTVLIHFALLTILIVFTNLIEFVLMFPLYKWESGMETTLQQVVLGMSNRYNVMAAIYMLIVLGYNIALYIHRYQLLKDQNSQYELKTEQLKGQLTQAQLQALKMQLNPHFLFNTLHSLVGLMMQNENRKAISMVNSLSSLLRTLVDTKDVNLVPLAHEIEFIHQYLHIQHIRFEDRLRVEWEIDPETKDGLVPQYVLQPLVENAIVHGIERLSQQALIRITSRRIGPTMVVEVLDNGAGFNQNHRSRRPGVGISSIRQRLERLYAESAHLSYDCPAGGGTRAILALPFTTEFQPVPPL